VREAKWAASQPEFSSLQPIFDGIADGIVSTAPLKTTLRQRVMAPGDYWVGV